MSVCVCVRFWNKWRKKTEGNLLTQVNLEHGHYTGRDGVGVCVACSEDDGNELMMLLCAGMTADELRQLYHECLYYPHTLPSRSHSQSVDEHE